MKKSTSGYVLILVAALIPVLIFGTKYVLDQRTVNEMQLNNGKAIDYEKLVKDVALTIAKNWNPALTLGQQKAAILKVADEEYNSVASSGLLSQAIPRLDISHWKKSSAPSNAFEPLALEQDSASISKIADYETKPKYANRYGFSNSEWNPYYAMWRTIDEKTAPENRVSEFDEMQSENGEFLLEHQDIFGAPMVKPGSSQFIVTTPNVGDDHNHDAYLETISYPGTATRIASDEQSYQSRGESNYMDISITSDDEIKVKIGDAESCAAPAQCDVDIVLAVPVNGAASNRYNQDAASSAETTKTPETADSSDGETIPEEIAATPIYQMGQACKGFVKEFYHTRGVSMGLIPYSGKVSVSPDLQANYVAAIPTFSEEYYAEHPATLKKISGAALYGASGDRAHLLTYKDIPGTDEKKTYAWGAEKTGCPIMSRRGETETLEAYANNPIAKGTLLSAAVPDSDELKYRKMNLNPCYLGYANFLSMRCDKTCETYQPNPYYMIEPTADLVKIYEMCNALYPIDDPYNVSNFVFIPVEWTRNFWKSWTTDPGASRTTGSSDAAAVSIPSKTDSGRKKALILLVNKPDWFEPGELTYVGFDNDYSEVPTYESDKIDFSINYDDANKKFLDDTYFRTAPNTGTDGQRLFAGPKKILRLVKKNGSNLERKLNTSDNKYYYECSEGTYRLKFPRKGNLKLTVAPVEGAQTSSSSGNGRFVAVAADKDYAAYSDDGINWTRSSSLTFSSGWCSVCYGGGLFVAANYANSKIGYSTDGITWSQSDVPVPTYSTYYGNGMFIAGGNNNNRLLYSSDGINWTSKTISSVDRLSSICYGNGKFVAVADIGPGHWASNISLYSSNGVDWNETTIPGQYEWQSVDYGNGKFVATYYSYVVRSSDGINWTAVSMPSSASRYCVCYGKDKFVITTGYKVAYSFDGISWTEPEESLSHTYWSVCYGGGKFVAVTRGGSTAACSEDGIHWTETTLPDSGTWYSVCYGEIGETINGGLLTFQNVSKYPGAQTIDGQKEFVLKAEDISDTKDSDDDYYIELDMKNLKLISAEISNLEILEQAPNCCLLCNADGKCGAEDPSSCEKKSTGNIPKTVYINTNCKEPITIRAKSTGGAGKVSFSGVSSYTCDGTTYSSGTEHTLSEPKTFTFSGGSLTSSGYSRSSNFGSKYSINKIGYSVTDAEITDATIAPNKQILRWSSAGKDTGLVVYGGSSERSSYTSTYYSYWTIVVMNLNDIYASWKTRYRESYSCNCSSYSCTSYYSLSPYCSGKQQCENDCVYGSATVGGNSVSYHYCFSCPCSSSASSRYINFYIDSGNATIDYGAPSGTRYNGGTHVQLYQSSYSSYMSISVTSYSSCDWVTYGSLSSGLIRLKANGTCQSCSTCYRAVDGSAGYMYYSAMNTLARSGSDRYGNSVPRTSTSTMSSSYRYSQPGNTVSYTRFYGAGGTSAVFYKIYSNGNYLDYFYAQNYGQAITWGGMNQSDSWVNNNQGITADGSYIKFNGDATISVTVSPTGGGDGQIKYKKANEEDHTDTISGKEFETVTISPDTHYYEKTATGYRVTLYITNVELDSTYGAQFVSAPAKIYRWQEVAHDEVNTRRVDYSNLSSPSYESGAISGNFATTYKAVAGGHSIAASFSSTSGISGVSPQIAWGDIAHISESAGKVSPYVGLAFGEKNGNYLFPGTTRLFAPLWRGTKDNNYLSMAEKSGNDETQSGGILALLTTNVTYPVNLVLAAGGYQGVDSNGVPTATPTDAAAQATADVCAKLKTDDGYGNNLRVYVVKYRKQAQYESFPFRNASPTTQDHDYSAVDGCATSSNYVYDVSTEADLKTTLSAVAQDIKTWAEYSQAANK